jgi:uncharacterized membrane protein
MAWKSKAAATAAGAQTVRKATKGSAAQKARSIWRGVAGRADQQRLDRRRNAIVLGSVAGAAALAVGGFITWRVLRARRQPVSMTGAITVSAPRGQVYSFWRDFENFRNFMRHVDDVQVLSERRSRWVLSAAAAPGAYAEWEAEIVEERHDERIVWQSVEGAPVSVIGEVQFRDAPGGGTEVQATLVYAATKAIRGTVASMLRRGLEAEMRADLGRFKQYIETGEVATTQGQPTGTKARRAARKAAKRLAEVAERLRPDSMAAQGG